MRVLMFIASAAGVGLVFVLPWIIGWAVIIAKLAGDLPWPQRRELHV